MTEFTNHIDFFNFLKSNESILNGSENLKSFTEITSASLTLGCRKCRRAKETLARSEYSNVEKILTKSDIENIRKILNTGAIFLKDGKEFFRI